MKKIIALAIAACLLFSYSAVAFAQPAGGGTTGGGTTGGAGGTTGGGAGGTTGGGGGGGAAGGAGGGASPSPSPAMPRTGLGGASE